MALRHRNKTAPVFCSSTSRRSLSTAHPFHQREERIVWSCRTGTPLRRNASDRYLTEESAFGALRRLYNWWFIYSVTLPLASNFFGGEDFDRFSYTSFAFHWTRWKMSLRSINHLKTLASSYRYLAARWCAIPTYWKEAVAHEQRFRCGR